MFTPDIEEQKQTAPKKQGRMFHLELGQNDGPFKSVRKEVEAKPKSRGGKGSVTQMPSAMAQSTKSHSIGPFKSTEDRLKEEATNSVSKQISTIEDHIMKGNEMLDDYKQKVQRERDDVQTLMDLLIERNEGVLGEAKPGITEDYHHLKSKIKEQKDENEQLYKHLLQLKKESAQTQQKINLCQSRILKLEDTLGIQAKTESLVFADPSPIDELDQSD